MHRFRWVILVALICLPVAFLAFDWHLPGYRETAAAQPLAVPDGDQEMAWLHTTTANTTWERYVTGWLRVQRTMPELEIDTSNTFLDSTTGVPELVLGMKGREAKLRIRWYKLQSDIAAADWVRSLAQRDRPPLAIIGGGSSDRAVELAKAMEAQRDWRGDRPALFITTATAVNLPASEPAPHLIDLYPGRSFRFCFNNRQMADAVLDYVEQTPDLRPAVTELSSLQAVGSSAIGEPKPMRYRPHVFSVQWADDPYSTDLHEQFSKSLHEQAKARGGNQSAFQLDSYGIPFSVGGFIRPNLQEEEAAKRIALELRGLPPQRSMLILPAATQPARRMLQAIAERSQRLTRRLVVVTGDGIPVNALLRDGDFAWRAGALPVPLVLFTHNDPIAWDDGIRWPRGPGSDSNTTEEFMHFAEMARIVIGGCYPSPTGELVTRSDDLIARLHARRPAFFDSNGERLRGTGEFVVTLLPREDAEGTRGTAQLSVWRRDSLGTWQSTGQLILGANGGATRP